MKRIKKLIQLYLLLVVLLIGLEVSLPWSGSDSSLFGGYTAYAAETKLTTVALNLRSGPSTGYSILLTMPKDSTVTVLSTNNGWSKVTYGSKTGYVFAAYLTNLSSSKSVVTYGVNLRTGPSGSYSIIQLIPKGSTVDVISTTGKWSKVQFNNKIGYVWSAYISPVNSEVSGTYYTTNRLNLRSGPSTNYSIFLTMPKGASVSVQSITNNWAKITYSGTTGYASMSFLSKTAPIEAEPSTIRKIYKGITSSSKKRIAITFDDGASVSAINKVLDILDRYNAKSTFFFTGDWMKSNPSLSRKIVSRGHKMESHTVSHPFLTKLSDASIRSQLVRSRNMIKDTVGSTSYLIRPPYGNTNSRVQRIAGEAGYKYIAMWSIDTDDYKSASTAASITRKAVAGASHNGILLLHPAHGRVVDALPRILSQLKDKGYSFTTVNEMLP